MPAKTRKYWPILLCLLLLTAGGCAKDKDEEQSNTPRDNHQVLQQQGLVNDFAGVLAPAERQDLTTMLSEYEKETCHQIIVLTVQNLDGESIEDFSTRTAQAWDIGQEFMKNGLLITLALDEGRARIEAASGLDWIVKDGAADRVLNQVMLPSFKKEQLTAGIRLGAEALMAEARTRKYPPDHRPSVCE